MRRALFLALLLAAPAAAEERVGVRTGDHSGRGRVVFDWADPPPYRVEQEGDRVRLHFPSAAGIDLPRRLPRNVLGAEREGEAILLRVAPGARIRHFRNGPKVAIDVLDAEPILPRQANRSAQGAAVPSAAEATPAPPSRPARPLPATSRGEAPSPGEVPAPAPMISPAATGPASAPRPEPPRAASSSASTPPSAAQLPTIPHPPVPSGPAPAAPPAPGPATTAAPPAPPRPALTEAALRPAPTRLADANAIVLRPQGADAAPELRLSRTHGTGLAAFRRGGRNFVVLDEERAVDASRLAGHPAWPGLEARGIAGGVVLSWTALAPPAIRRDGADWVIAARAEAAPAPLQLRQESSRAVISAPGAAKVVTLADPETELPLLVGTLDAPGARRATGRALAEFELLETEAGLVVLARADRITLRTAPGRFLLGIEGGELALAGEAPLPPAGNLSRSFDLPAQPVPRLLERLRAAQAQVAAAAPLTRAVPRLAAAEALLALGLPQEAQAMLRLAGQESPDAARDPRHAALAAMAGLLADRPNEEAHRLDATLPPTDELRLWRAVQSAREGDARAAAPGFAATAPLLLAYPEPLRRRLLPLAAETLAAHDVPAARQLIEQAGDESGLQMAQALLDEATGEDARALEAYEAVAAGRDRRQRARALRRAAELRLSTGRIDAAAAARALEQTLFAWRGDGDEVALRRRVAALRQQASDPRGAMAMLREAEAAFPDAAAQLRPALQESFLSALANESPLGAVALHDSQPDLLPADPAGEAALAALAERLGALDLADRAAALLGRAMTRLPPGPAKAALGARLAAHRLAERDADGALAALAASAAVSLAPALTQERTILAARAEARRGRREVAAEALSQLGAAGDEALAEILAEARDFAGAAAALARHLAAVAPPPAPLAEPAQRATIRLAALLAMAGDERALAGLRRSHGPRMAQAPLAGAFEALTADPVRGLADLPRLARELNLFRSLGQMREPLRTAALPTG
jgi:hypothetical protein